MNKRNGIVITFVLLLLLGTGSFVFANPSEEKKEDTKRNQEQVIEQNKPDSNHQSSSDSSSMEDLDDEGTDEGVFNEIDQSTVSGTLIGSGSINTPIVVPGGGNHGNRPTTPVIPQEPSVPNVPENPDKPSVSIDDILEKLEDLEQSFDSSIYDEIINMLPNLPESDQLEEIKKELEIIKKEMNTLELFRQLVSKVSSASKRDDILAAKKFEFENQIATNINAFREGDQKKQLLSELADIMKILDDQDAPIITGLSDHSVVNANIAIQITDGNDYVIFLDEVMISINELNSKLTHGTHVIRVVDKAFHETVVTFEVDTEKPVVDGIQHNKYYNASDEVRIYVEDDHQFDIHLEKDGSILSYQLGELLTEDGSYTFYAYDEVGNVTDTYQFVIDTVFPTANVRYSTTLATNENVVATLEGASEAITILNNNGSSEYVFEENGTFEFKIQDKAGNVSSILAEVNNIDKEAPKFEQLGILNLSRYNTNEDVRIALPNDEVLVYVTFLESLGILPEIKINNTTLAMDFDATHSTDQLYVYTAKYQVKESDLGNISFSIFGYADHVLNKGETLDHGHVNSLEHTHVEVVETPGFEFVDGGSFNTNEIVITNPDYYYMEVYKGTSKKPIKVTETTYKVTSNTRYTFVLYDKDGNEIERAIMVYDSINPKIVATGTLQGSTSNIEEGVVYDNVSLTITDNDIHFIKRMFEDGSEQVLKEFGQYDSDRRSCTLDFSEGGNYNIVAVDRAGNETSVHFAVSEKSLMLSAVLSIPELS